MIEDKPMSALVTVREVKITFDSMFMGNDSLTYTDMSIEDARQQYLAWWKGYGKDEVEAMRAIISTEVVA